MTNNIEENLEKYRKLGLMKEYPVESTKDKTEPYHGNAIQESMHLMRILPYSILEEYSEPSKNNPNTKIVNVDKIPEKIKQFYEIIDAIRFFRK